MKEIDQNILDVKIGIIVHAVNCKGVWGAGLAKHIKYQYPKAYNDYITFLKQFSNSYKALGGVCLTQVGNLCIASVFTQYDTSVASRRTEYSAVMSSMINLKRHILYNRLDLPLYFPNLMCCGLGGGDWNIVKEIIEESFPKAYICKI